MEKYFVVIFDINFLIKLTYSISHKMQFIKNNSTCICRICILILLLQESMPVSFPFFICAFLNTRTKMEQRETENTTKVFFSVDHARKNILRYIFFANMKNEK